MKKVFLIVMVLTLGVSCSTTQREKFVEKTSEKVKQAAVKYLSCNTGDAAKESVKKTLSRALKLNSSKESGQGDVWGTVCEQAVKLALPFLINIGEKKLPQSWKDDGCNFDKLSEDATKAASQLCGYI